MKKCGVIASDADSGELADDVRYCERERHCVGVVICNYLGVEGENIVSYQKVAYGKPKNIKGAGKLLNIGANVGTRIVQFVYVRPPAVGYRIARTGRWRR